MLLNSTYIKLYIFYTEANTAAETFNKQDITHHK